MEAVAAKELALKDAVTWKKPDKHKRDTFAEDMAQCEFMIRGKRRCQNRSSDGSAVCQLHEPSRLAKERELSILKKRPRGCDGNSDEEDPEKKHRIRAIKRISGSQNRMFNGFSSPPNDAGVQGLPVATGENDDSWSSLLHNPSLPVHVDIGCARGVLVNELAERHPTLNFIGVEVRDKLVAEANALLPTGILTERNNCRFLSANLLNEKHRNQLEAGLRTLSNIERVSILFPDPWIKQKHRNRRIIQLPVIQSIANFLLPGGLFIIASDVEDMMVDAKEKMNECGDIFSKITATHPLVMESMLEDGAGAVKAGIDDDGYVLFNPFRPLASEREQVCEMSWRRVYRLIYVRK